MSGVPSATAARSVMLMTVSSSRVVVIVAMASHPRHQGRRLGPVAGGGPSRRWGGRALPDHDPLAGLEARDDLRRDPAHDAHPYVAVLNRPVGLHYPHHRGAV